MTLHLYGDENQVIKYLKGSGLTEPAAKIYTAILCRQYRAPKEELVSLLKFHLPGSSDANIRHALDNLLQLGLLKVIDGLQEDPIEARNPWEEVLKESLLNNNPVDPAIAQIVDDSWKTFADFSLHERNLIERLGWATWEKPRDAFREAIKQANQKIRLGVYSSITVYNEIQNEIRDALINRQQIEVQILMFSPKLAAKVENNPDLGKDVEIRTNDWKRLFAEAKKEAQKHGHQPKLEIRHLVDEKMAAFHRVMLVDEWKWILNVHRPGVERGIEGIVYQGSCENRNPSNLYALLDHYWNAAWESGVNPSPLRRALHHVGRYRHFLILFFLVILAWYLNKSNDTLWGVDKGWKDWLGGAFAGLVVGEVYKDGSKIIHDVLELLKSALSKLQKLLTSRT